MLYLILWAVGAALALVDSAARDRAFSLCLLLAATVTLVLVSSLRFETGTDWAAYYAAYNERSLSKLFEPGFRLANDWFSANTVPFNYFLLAINGVTLSFIAIFLFRLSHYYLMGIVLYYSDLFFLLNMSGIRQGAALGLIALAIACKAQNRNLIYLSMILLASSFHFTAFAALLIYFIPSRKVPTLIWLPLAALSVCTLFSISDLVAIVSSLGPKDYSYYLLHLHDDEQKMQGLIIGGIKRAFIIVLFAVFHRRVLKSDVDWFLFNVYVVGFLIFIATYYISPDIGIRISLYFLIVEIALVGRLIYGFELGWQRIAITVSLLGPTLYKLVKISQSPMYYYQLMPI